MTDKILIQIAQDIGEVKSDVKAVRADVEDIQPRVEMLNHWHNEVNSWMKKQDRRFKAAAIVSAVGGGVYTINAAVNLWQSVSHYLGR